MDKPPNADNETYNQTTQANPDVLVSSGVSASPPPKTHYETTCKQERDGLAKFKDGAEIVGIFLLMVYTAYTIKIYCLTKQSLDLNTKTFLASQAAGFSCQASGPANTNDSWAVLTCINEGNVPARGVAVDATFTRSDSGVTAQSVSRKPPAFFAVKGEPHQYIFPINETFDAKKWALEDFEIKATLKYNNGIEDTSQDFCFSLTIGPNGSTSWATCENAADVKKYPRQ